MSYTGRDRDTIRDELLTVWSAQYAALGGPALLVAPGSDAYILAGALATVLEGLEAQAEQTARDILPDEASTTALNRHGDVDGVARRAGTNANFDVTVTNGVNGVKPIAAGTVMTYSDGSVYDVTSTSVTIAGGTGTIACVAALPGTAYTRGVGDTLTFSATPSGVDPTGLVAGTPDSGTDAEGDASYAARIIARRQERPASGNRGDWQDWPMQYTATEIVTAYVYPLLSPPVSYPGVGTVNTLGTVTVIPVGPAQGDSLINTREVPSDDATTRGGGESLPRIKEFIEGTRAANGAEITDGSGTQLRPVTMAPTDYSVETLYFDFNSVSVEIVNNDANPFPWTGVMVVDASSTSTSLVVAGNHLAKEALGALVMQDVPTVRGWYKSVTLGPATFAAGLTTFDQTGDPIESDPVTGSDVLPMPPNWQALRLACFAFMDSLGPGDTTPPSRWPGEDIGALATFYPQALSAALMQVAGVLSAEVISPGVVTPAQKAVVQLTSFRVTEA